MHDITGKQIASLPLGSVAGLQVLQWNARTGGARGQRGRGGGGRRRFGGGSPVAPGSYSVRYRHGEEQLVQPLIVRADPDGRATPLSHPASNKTSSRN